MRQILIAVLAILTVGCSNQQAQQNPRTQVFSSPKTLADLAEQDATAYKAMALACETKNFDAYLRTFTISPRIRADYSAWEISLERKGRTQKVLAKDNYYYPLVLKDDTWLATSDFSIAYKVEDEAPDQKLVIWEHKPLDPTATFTDEELKAVKEKGELTFAFVEGCWRLMSDRRVSG
jgi:hypothetical protein